MQKRISRPSDVSQWAHQIVAESTDVKGVSPKQISKVMAEMGRRGGKIGGKRRLETMTAEERSNAASNAAKKRWAKTNGSGKT